MSRLLVVSRNYVNTITSVNDTTLLTTSLDSLAISDTTDNTLLLLDNNRTFTLFMNSNDSAAAACVDLVAVAMFLISLSLLFSIVLIHDRLISYLLSNHYIPDNNGHADTFLSSDALLLQTFKVS